MNMGYSYDGIIFASSALMLMVEKPLLGSGRLVDPLDSHKVTVSRPGLWHQGPLFL